MTVLWTSVEAAAATGGQATAPWQASGVSIDTRSLRPGDLFVALKDQRDGHDFVADALANGAAAALVTHRPADLPADAPLLIVPDVLAALADLARAARARTGAKIVAVTGSAGKTSTKEMLRTVLSRQGRCHAAEASYNNHWGVPLTLARMPADCDFAVIEIGMSNPGEISPLSHLTKPDVAMVTTVAAAHLAAFDDLAGIAAEKACIMDGLGPGGVAVLNADIETAPILQRHAEKSGVRQVVFGQKAQDWQLREVRITGDVTVITAQAADLEYLFKLAVPGRHFAMNALGVLAVVAAIGADPAQAARDIEAWAPPAGRGARERIVLDPAREDGVLTLLDDAFNANPSSLAAALEVLAAGTPTDGVGRVHKGRRIAVLGDMLELGPAADEMHRAMADNPHLQALDLVHCAGTLMRALWQALPEGQRGLWAESAADLAAQAPQLADAGDIVLVKGSKGSRVSLVVDAFRKLGHRRASQQQG